MVKQLLFIFVSFIALSARAQPEYFNSNQFWHLLVLEDTIQAEPGEIQTGIVVVSSRAKTNDKLRFMGERYSKDGVSYFFVYAHKDKWHVLPVRNISDALQYIPHKEKDWVVYTEGMGKIFTSDVDRGMRLAQQYDVNVVMLDYPSIISTGSAGNYFFAIHHARQCYKDFVPILDTIKILRTQQKMGAGSINLFFHSMGNNLVRKTVRKKLLTPLNDTKWVNNLILNAPCVYQHNHNRWVNRIKFANAIYVHYNPHDNALQGAHFISMHKQLGEKVRKPLSIKATYINFNTLCGKEHTNFLALGKDTALPAAFKHYNTLFHGDTVNVLNNKLYQPSIYRNIGWDILPEQFINSLNAKSRPNYH